MRVVALEEHFTVPALARRIDPQAASRRGFRPRKAPTNTPNPLDLLPDLGEARVAAMDAAGITVQVLSNTGPGPDLVPGADGIALARELNDHLAGAIARHPDRYAGFAVLPMHSPEAGAAELKRAVKDLRFSGALINGTTEGRFLDHPSYDGLLAAAVELDVPIYIHPHLPPEPVRQAYYSDLRAGRGPRAAKCRLGLAFGDGHPRAAPGDGGDARPTSPAQAHHRPHGRDAAHDARSASTRSPRSTSITSPGQSAAPFSTRSGSRPVASSASRRYWLRCSPSASTASCFRSITPIPQMRKVVTSLAASRLPRRIWPSSRIAMRMRC